MKRFVPILILALYPVNLPAQNQTTQTPPTTPAAPAKKPDGPLNTHSRAGVRGGLGHPIAVRVQLRGTAVPGAHITVTAADGKVAGTGDTGSSGVFTLSLEDGDYSFAAAATAGGDKSSIHFNVEPGTRVVTVELAAAPTP